MDKKWYVNFVTRTGHTNTHFVEAPLAVKAVELAVAEYVHLQSIRVMEAFHCVTEVGLR